eukprot:scaffold90771_cov15-Tisochrysis_lutea.AAC.2
MQMYKPEKPFGLAVEERWSSWTRSNHFHHTWHATEPLNCSPDVKRQKLTVSRKNFERFLQQGVRAWCPYITGQYSHRGARWTALQSQSTSNHKQDACSFPQAQSAYVWTTQGWLDGPKGLRIHQIACVSSQPLQ